MVGCAVTGCKKRRRGIADECYVRSDSEGSEDDESLVKRLEPRTFHRFPVRTELKQIWLNNIGREDWNGSKTACVCSDHFKESDINRIANKNIRRSHNVMLKPGAVPTRFKTIKRKLIHQTVMLNENPHPVADIESQDSTTSVSDLTYFDENSPSKRISSPRTENEMEEIENLDQSMVYSNEIEIEPENIKFEVDAYFISENEEIREGTILNHKVMKNEIIMLNKKLREALQKISSYEKLNLKEKLAKVETEKKYLEKKLSKTENLINFNEKKMNSIIDSYKKKMDLKKYKTILLQQKNHRSVKIKDRLKSKNKEIRMLQQSNRRLLKTKERLRNIICELKNKSLVKKINLKKNKKDYFCGTYRGLEACSDGVQHHTFEIVERMNNNKADNIWRKKETLSSEDRNGLAEGEFDRRKNSGIKSIVTDPTPTIIPKDVVRLLHEDVFVTKSKEKMKEKCSDNIENPYLQLKIENKTNDNTNDLFCELDASSNEINKRNLYISRKITKKNSINTAALPNLKNVIPSVDINCSNDESKICEKYDTLNNVHAEDKAEEQPNQIETKWIYQCNHCDKCLSSKVSLLSHQRIHIKPFECSHCGKSFSRNTALVQHVRLHTGEKPYTCSHCSKSFAHLNNFRRHKKMHTGEKPYTCNICEKNFTRKVNLEEHKLIHTGDNKFICIECGKCFAQKSTLVHHQRIHTGEKPYLCNYCGKSFTLGTTLEKHKRRHTGEKPYICSQCSKSFSQWNGLAQHQKTHHKESYDKDGA